MTKEQFEQFVKENQQKLPLYFKDFEYKETFVVETEKMKLQKIYSSNLYQTNQCRVEKPYKNIIRIDD